jgi:hypothetical protein
MELKNILIFFKIIKRKNKQIRERRYSQSLGSYMEF